MAAIVSIGVPNSWAQAGRSQLPDLGDNSELTSSAERRMGDRIAREIYRDPDYIDDPVLLEYVQSVWQPLLAAARLRGDLPAELDGRFAFEVMLGKDRSVNAFALPGGYLGLHLGLLAVVNNRDELASVLAHELSHVTQRHISRLISKQNAQAPWAIGAMILGVLAASKSPEAANALIVGGQAVAQQAQLNFSRDMEREADRIGFGVMAQAGFEPRGFVTMFDKLQQSNRLTDSGAFPYLRSHPLTTERIADMQGRLPQSAAAPTPPSTSGRMAQAMLTARAQVLSNSGVDALRTWAGLAAPIPLQPAPNLSIDERSSQALTLYGAALAASRLRDFTGAAAQLAKLSALTKSDAAAGRLYRLLAAELALAADDVPQAATHLAMNDTVLKTLPDASADKTSGPAVKAGRPEVILGAATAIRAGRANDAAERLQSWVATYPRDAQAWQLLSSAHAALGKSLRAIRADAESQVALLDYAAASDRFKAAQELARELARKGQADHIEASIIDSRSRQVALLLREQALER
jgi:predicted Zn-dependent protease